VNPQPSTARTVWLVVACVCVCGGYLVYRGHAPTPLRLGLFAGFAAAAGAVTYLAQRLRRDRWSWLGEGFAILLLACGLIIVVGRFAVWGVR
jgi:hypothetical protein